MTVFAGRLSVAPMMDWTDRHFRYFARRLTRRTLLYSEMITAQAIVFGDAEKLLAYDGAQMFFSAKYDAYCYLVVSELSADEVKTDAEAKIAQADGTAIQIGYTGDVNQTGKIDINDAQMAYNMYGSALYDGFEKATIRMYLEADMNGDKAVDTADATAIVSEIK